MRESLVERPGDEPVAWAEGVEQLRQERAQSGWKLSLMFLMTAR